MMVEEEVWAPWKSQYFLTKCYSEKQLDLYRKLSWFSFSDTDDELAIRLKVAHGRHAIEELSEDVKKAHDGEIVVVSSNGDILAYGKDLHEINAKLKGSGMPHGGYMARIGSKPLAKIRR